MPETATSDDGSRDGVESGGEPTGAADDGPDHGADGEGAVSSADPVGYDVSDPESREFGLRGWGLVAALVIALVVIPWTIIGIPAAQGLLETLPLGYRDAYLVLPFVPAVFLGALGVWTALANRRA